MTLIHATCVSIDGRAVLIEGPSGAGKSDLALRLLGRGAVLVGDDYVEVRRDGGKVVARAPDKIAGRMEVRGVGIIEADFIPEAEVVVVVELKPREEVPRLPEPRKREVEGCQLPVFALHAFEHSAPDKVLLLLAGEKNPKNA